VYVADFGVVREIGGLTREFPDGRGYGTRSLASALATPPPRRSARAPPSAPPVSAQPCARLRPALQPSPLSSTTSPGSGMCPGDLAHQPHPAWSPRSAVAEAAPDAPRRAALGVSSLAHLAGLRSVAFVLPRPSLRKQLFRREISKLPGTQTSVASAQRWSVSSASSCSSAIDPRALQQVLNRHHSGHSGRTSSITSGYAALLPHLAQQLGHLLRLRTF